MTQNDHKPQSYQDAVDSGLPAISGGGMAMNTVAAREIGEIQGAIVVAQRVPRNEERAFKEIMNACKRPTLAKSASYLFPRGGQTVTGPSIRLAEVLARYWGNIQYGIRELSRSKEETLFESYAWDVQTNTRVSRRFSQKHWRDTRGGGYALTDERDIYEAVANSGARRLRACILEIIPGDIVEEALAVCAQTKVGKSDVPMKDRLRQLIVAFDAHGVTEEMIVDRLGHKLDQISPVELAELRDIYTSIKDGMASRDQWFETHPAPGTDDNTDLNAKFADASDPTPPAAAKTAKSKKEPKKEPAKKKGRPKSAADDAKRDLDVQEKTINGSGVVIDAPIPGEKAEQMETGSFANF